MADEYTATIRIRRPSKVKTDERGRTVWVDAVETAELELVSTRELKQLLASDDPGTLSAIEKAVLDRREGILARDPATGLFQIISEADLQSFHSEEDLPKTAPPADVTLEPLSGGHTEHELSLVSTQMLRKVLRKDAAAQSAGPGAARRKQPTVKKDEGGGFDPYDSG